MVDQILSTEPPLALALLQAQVDPTRMLGDGGAAPTAAQGAARGGYGQAAGSAGYSGGAAGDSGYGAAGGGAASGYGTAGGAGGGAGGGGSQAVLQQLLNQGFSMQEVLALAKSRPDLAAKLGLAR
jgi:hypothetical protein